MAAISSHRNTMKTSVKIGKLFGIPVKLHITLIIVVAIIAWSIGSNMLLIANSLGIPDPEVHTGLMSYLIGLILAVGLFVSVFIHELAHSLVSIGNGVKVNEISLWLFGGISSMDEIPKDPNLEIKISVVGPLSSLAIGVITFAGGLLSPNSVLAFMLLYIGSINFLLAGFNLIPAFPMDGGRILRALMAKKLPYAKATRTAADVGKVFAVIFGIIGLFYNIFLILIAFFIYMAASQESQSVMVREVLGKVMVREIMSKDVKTVSTDMAVEEFLKEVMTYQHTGFPVVRDGNVVGIVTLGDTKKIDEDKMSSTRVSDIMETNVIFASPNDDVGEIWKTMLKKQFGRFPVTKDGQLVGIITRSDVLHSFNILSELERFRGNEI